MTNATSPYLNQPIRSEAEARSNVYDFADHRAPVRYDRPCDVGDYEMGVSPLEALEDGGDPMPDATHDEHARAQRAQSISNIKLAFICAALVLAIAVIGSMVP